MIDDLIIVDSVSHSYAPTRKRLQPRHALNNVSLTIAEGTIFCLLGPNGSGKSTLFRILSTLLRPQAGSVRMMGYDLVKDADAVRHSIGVVFQHPSLDKKLTTRENLQHQGHLYGMRGNELQLRITEMLTLVGMNDRRDDLVETLSGGTQRRVELAKSLLHRPRLLLLDEPSTGLDPSARREFGDALNGLRISTGLTAILTSHLLDEAERSDRLAILDQGELVACSTPSALKAEIGGDVVSLTTGDATQLSAGIREKFAITPHIIGDTVRCERANAHEFIPQLVTAFPGLIKSITLSKPSLEDVFIRKTGHHFENDRS